MIQDEGSDCPANQQGLYYKIWDLRNPKWCPDECWQRIRLLYASRMVNIPVHSAWIEFDSAFGGLAIYRCKALMAGH